MALVLKDRVKETTTTAGSGDITLGGAAGPFQAFSTLGNGNTTYYAIVGQTSTEWEVGLGTYVSSGNNLTRDTILASSNSNTIVTFSAGVKDVFVTYPAEKAIYEEADGDTLINAGPITVLGPGTGNPTPFTSTLGRFYGNVDNYSQVYNLNQFDGADASADFVAYNNASDGSNYFVDMGINSESYASGTYPVFTQNSAYLFTGGDTGVVSDLFFGTSTGGDIIFFTNGVATSDIKARITSTAGNFLLGSNTDTGEKLQVTGTAKITGATTFGSTVTLNADPATNLEAATKQYVDTAVSTGLHVHEAVRVSTQNNLTATYSNGSSGVGATLTNSGSQAALVIDGITMAVNDRVLVWQQSTQFQNGIYVVSNIGSGSTNWVLTRSSDADTYVPLSDTGLGGGDYFFVQSGTLGAGDSYICTNDSTITFGTTAITFAQFSGAITYIGGTNIDVTGQTISLTGTVAATNGGTGTATVTTGDLLYGSAANTWSKLAKGAAYQSLVMDGAGTNVQWNAVNLSSSAAVTGTLGATFGGTGQTTYAVGDIIYSGVTDTLSKLSGNTSTTKQFLSQTGTGSASQAPSWASLNASDIQSGTLGAVLGGTGQSSYAVGDLLYADTTTSLAKLSDVATGNVLLSGGVSTAPAWGKVALASAVSGTLGITNGGTGQTTANAAFNALAPSQTSNSGKYLTTDGSNTSWATIAAGTTFSAGTTGFTPNTATSGTVTLAGTLNVANGGTGSTTAQTAINTLAGATTSGYYLRGNGTNVVMAAIVAGDVPTLNQNTTGTAGNVTGTVAITNGGTGATSAAAALSALGAYPANNPSGYTNNTGTVTSITGGTYLTGGTITTSGTLAVDATTTNTASKVVARDASGNFSAGTITANLSGSATTFTSTTQNSQFNSVGVGTAASGTAGEIRATNNVTAYYSDDRFKTNLGNIPNALDKVQTLNGFYYEANELAQSYGYEKKLEVGVSAQQVQAIMPEVVAPAPIDEDYLTVRYERLVPLLIEAIKELKAEVDELKKAK
jgi:hypothetical protein